MVRMLTGPELAVLHAGIVAAYDENSLAMMLLFRLNQPFQRGDDFSFQVFKLVQKANMGGWWTDLLVAARNAAPRNPILIEAEERLSIAPQNGGNENLEKVVDLRSGFHDVDEFGRRHGQIVNSVCAIEDSGGGGLGTGWLLWKDIVITNYHVVQGFLRGAERPHCRFDFKIVDGAKEDGRVVSLAEKWCIAYRPYSQADVNADIGNWQPEELDYALLRLDEPVGLQAVGHIDKAEPGAKARGWVTLTSAPPTVESEDRLWVFQHPQDISQPGGRRLQPMKLSDGKVLGWYGNGVRMRHDARTLPGSSGSICCDAQLRLVALHHAGDPRDWPDYRGKYNQAIPVQRIAADVIARAQNGQLAVEPFWDTPSRALA